MSVLKEYEERMKLEPLTEEEIDFVVDDAEAFLAGGYRSEDSRPVDEDARVVLWLVDKIEALTSRVPTVTRCLWCLDAADRTDEALLSLPAMSLDDVKEHVRGCPHNPLVQDLRELRDTVIGLATDEAATSGELRKRLLELAGLLQ